jgi:uncharacterized protein YecT (DUF1311 family)
MFPVSSHSQNQKKHPIERALEACIDKDSSTAGMTNCADKALESWDKELNRVYNELARKLDPEGKLALKAAQSEWIKYRDSEYGLIDAVYYHMEGTMYIPMRVEARTRIVRERSLALEHHLELLKEQ